MDIIGQTGLRFASSASANGIASHSTGFSSADIASAVPSTPDQLDLSQFIVETDTQSVVALDGVGPSSEPLFDLSSMAMDMIPTAAQIEIVSWAPTGTYQWLQV